jgi:hypothetical protein
MKSWTVSWLSLKTKVEPGLRGSRVMSVLTPKIDTGKGLSCGLSLVKNAIRQENLLKGFSKDTCGRQYAIIQ